MHLLSIVGARPQFVKAAMIVESIDRYNRQRQAVITTELIEIIAGSEALQG